MKVLVVGGAGFIGSHLDDALLSDKNQVTVADDLSLGRMENINQNMSNPDFKFIKIDAAKIDELSNVFENGNFDMVFHLAANSDIQKSSKDPSIDLNKTFLTTYNVIECMRRYNVKKLFFSSTSAIYGEKMGINIHEDIGPLQPISYYGAGKMASEAFISAYAYMNDFKVWITRFPNVIGERSTHGVIYDFIRKLNDDPHKLVILGDGTQCKPYIYVRDLVGAILHVCKNTSEKYNYYNVGVETKTSVKEIADIICEEMGLKGVEYCYTGGKIGWKGDVPSFQYDLSKIHNTGWKAQYASNEAVRISVRRILGK